MLKESVIRIQKSVPLLTDLPDDQLPFWIFLHGYAQNIKAFSEPIFNAFSGKINLIFPQAPSHFYRKGTNGELSASWMTKHYREYDMQDQIDYLTSVIQNFIPNNKKVSFFGFSQGAPVATRIAEKFPGKIDRIVLWSGNTDPKTFDQLDFIGRKITIEHIHGDTDKFVEKHRWEEYFEMLKKGQILYSRKIYNGGHFFDESLLKKHFKL
jgi:predicted esterase